MKNKSMLRAVLQPKMLVILLLGFSSGLPLLLVGSTLKLWLSTEKVDLSLISYITWTTMAYSLKFIWAPFLDRYSFLGMERRKSWMILSQLCLVGGLVAMGTLDPKLSLGTVAAIALAIAFFSATQDIAIDAYRREICTDEELGLASSMIQYGYRIGMLVAGGVAIGLVKNEVPVDPAFPDGEKTVVGLLSWGQMYYAMAACMAVGLVTALLAPAPEAKSIELPKSLKSAIIDPFKEFATRDGALVILLFVFLFKLGDALGASLLNPYYREMGFTNQQIGFIAKTVGMSSALVGLFIGGLMIWKWGFYRSLWFFGILQALSTAGFALLTFTGPQSWALAVTVVFEDVSAGMGSAAFVAFIASATDRRYTATQYAVLSSIALLGRTFFAGFMGPLQKEIGWANLYYLCALIALPGLFMLFKMKRYIQSPSEPAAG